MTTIIPDNKYHDRWIIDEEIADAVKDQERNALGNYTNLNRITTTTWTFNHQGGHIVGDYISITRCVKKKISINKRQSITFYYITLLSNQVTQLITESLCNNPKQPALNRKRKTVLL